MRACSQAAAVPRKFIRLLQLPSLLCSVLLTMAATSTQQFQHYFHVLSMSSSGTPIDKGVCCILKGLSIVMHGVFGALYIPTCSLQATDNPYSHHG